MKLRELAVAMVATALMIMGVAPAAQATQGGTGGDGGTAKVWVCKYSGTPYVDETLKSGKNPIAVSASATTGTWFKDRHGQSYVLDQVTWRTTARDGSYSGGATCPTGRTFDWDWTYDAPTCAALTVEYPATLPSGQAKDVNVTIKNTATGATKTLNFHKGYGTWSGTQTFTFASHPQWPGWSQYAVTWIQVAGTNHHWQGSVSCGEREKPAKPEPRVTTGSWEISDYLCGTSTVKKTRTVTTTDWTWDATAWEWKPATASSTSTETKTRAMTAEEKAEHCGTTEIDVCSNIDGIQTSAPSGWTANSDGTCSKCKPPKVDVCTNLPGDQTTVPEGMEVDEKGRCTTPPPVDVCANIEGDQAEVPEGMEVDDEGTCAPPPTDLCLNVDGVQAELPAGVEVDEHGDCAMEATTAYGDWNGAPVCGVSSYTKWRTGTLTTYAPALVDGVWEWVVDTVEDLGTFYMKVDLEEVVPCEDAAASIDVTPARCDAPGALGAVTAEHATAQEEPATTPGTHTVTFVAAAGHAFAGGASELAVEYTIEDQLTDGCAGEPQEPSIDGTLLGEQCTADAPYLTYDIVLDDPDGLSTDDGTATIRFVHPTDAALDWTTTVDIGSGRILWPGADVDEDGVAIAWPSWEYNAATEEWEPVGDGNYGWTREPDTQVIIEVNPTKEFTVTYPPATPECNSEPPTDIVVVLDAPPATAVTGVATYTG
ncbi:hypothetical protein [Demequina iriomotensis]|uniref:hypothetical protein n=1 Tax=Demequina iriomotensis TaxID=1536641 RepID=UPI0007844E26|nr:hypothetical protein [Demequina iriomotensis]